MGQFYFFIDFFHILLWVLFKIQESWKGYLVKTHNLDSTINIFL